MGQWKAIPTHTLPDQRCREHQAELPRRQLRIAFDKSLRDSIGRLTGGEVLIRTFNSGIIFVNKMWLNELDRQRAFSDTTTAYDNELVFTKKLCLKYPSICQWPWPESQDKGGYNKLGTCWWTMGCKERRMGWNECDGPMATWSASA